MRVTCEVTAVKDNGIEAKLLDHDLTTFIRRSDLSRDRSEQRPDRFGVGEKFDAVVTQFDAKSRKVSASIKALEIAEEKEAVAQYGSTDSGASLGDILGAALNKAKDSDDDGEAEVVEAEVVEAEVKEAEVKEAAAKPKKKRAAKSVAKSAAEDEAATEASPEE